MGINKVRKLPFPDFLSCTEYTASLNQAGLTPDGEPMPAVMVSGKCIYCEKSKRVINTNGKEIQLVGKVIIKGDIAPLLNTVSDGVITINGNTYEIYSSSRPRNPDGSIHHTELEVM